MATTGRTITPRLYIGFDGVNWVDCTADLIAARGEMKLTAPGSAVMSPRGTVDRMVLTLHNPLVTGYGRKYSPLNASGALYASLQNGGAYHRRVILEVSIDNADYARVFTGVIKLPRESSPLPGREATVEIDCRSVDEDLLQLKLNTTHTEMIAAYNAGYTEADYIKQWLSKTEVGIPEASRSIDPGMFVIPFVWLDDESVIEEMWSLAAACGGRVYADPDGKIVYENMAHWLQHSTSTESFTRDNYRSLEIRADDADLFNEITVEASPRIPKDEDVLWEPGEEQAVPAGGRLNVTARMKYPAYTITGVSYEGLTKGGQNISADLTVSRLEYAQRVILIFDNANTTYAANLYGLQIHGRPIVGAPVLEEKKLYEGMWWAGRRRRSRSLRGNTYIQTRAHANAIASFLQDTHLYPAYFYTMAGVPGVPTRRLGQCISINDSEVMSAARTAYITGISWVLDGNGFTQQIEAIDAANLYAYTLADYFIIDTDHMDGNDKRLFY